METRNFQKIAEQAAVAALVISLGSKPRGNPVQKPTMTAQEFAEIWRLPINKNGVIVGPWGYIYQDPEPLLERLLRVLLGLPNTQPLMFVTNIGGPRPILDGGKDNSAWYAIRMIGLHVEDSVSQLRQFGWRFELELTQALNVLCTHQKCIVCGTHKRGDEFGTYGRNSDGSFRLKAYCKECDATNAA